MQDIPPRGSRNAAAVIQSENESESENEDCALRASMEHRTWT